MKNVRLRYTGLSKRVQIAVEKTNEILASREFYDQIVSYSKFDNTALSPEIIAILMREADYEIRVRVNWILPDVSRPSYDRIVLSGWHFGPHLATNVNTLICETVSALDRVYDIMSKDNNRWEGQYSSAHLVIGAIAEVLVR